MLVSHSCGDRLVDHVESRCRTLHGAIPGSIRCGCHRLRGALSQRVPQPRISLVARVCPGCRHRAGERHRAANEPRWTRDWRSSRGMGAAAMWLNDQLQHSPQPVFLCAGLLEDLALTPRADQQLVDYCLFPVSGIHRLQADHLEPLPTTTTVTLTPSQQQLVERSRGMWLIVRAGPKTTSGIATRLCWNLQREMPGAMILQRHRFGTVTVLQLGVE